MGPGRSIRESKDFHHGEGREPRRITERLEFRRFARASDHTRREAPCCLSPWPFVVLGLLRGKSCLIASHAKHKTEGVGNTTLSHQSIDNHGPKRRACPGFDPVFEHRLFCHITRAWRSKLLIPTALISDRSAGVGPLVLSLGSARGRPTNPARDTRRPK
jgi:hypothetical protein